jgi:hypothetical protein
LTDIVKGASLFSFNRHLQIGNTHATQLIKSGAENKIAKMLKATVKIY